MCVCAQSCLALWDLMDCGPPASSVHGISQARNTGAGCRFLLQGVFLTQGSNPHILHCGWIFYHYVTWEAWSVNKEKHVNALTSRAITIVVYDWDVYYWINYLRASLKLMACLPFLHISSHFFFTLWLKLPKKELYYFLFVWRIQICITSYHLSPEQHILLKYLYDV